MGNPQTDPYAAYGGAVEDPYAAYGGSIAPVSQASAEPQGSQAPWYQRGFEEITREGGKLLKSAITPTPIAAGQQMVEGFKRDYRILTGKEKLPGFGENAEDAAASAVNFDKQRFNENVANKNYVGAGLNVAMPVAEAAVMGRMGKKGGVVPESPEVQPIAAVRDALPGSEMKQARIIQALIPEAKSLPPKAISGVEDVFMASAPTSTKVGFRNNLYVAAPDLADIARKVELSDSAGGIKNPDMRVRATTDAIKSHLDEMYQQERAPQIQRAAAVPVNMNLGADAIEGLKYMKRSGANAEVRAIAASALEEGVISMADADKLAIPTNSMLRGFEAMTPAERAQAAMASRRLESLKALDVGLSSEMNKKLQSVGETGLYDYERRYAALSQIKQQLERRTNAVELDQPGIIKGIIKPVGNVVKAMTGSPAGITSASQAAVADVNIGRRLQGGFRKLKDSGITRSAATNPTE